MPAWSTVQLKKGREEKHLGDPAAPVSPCGAANRAAGCASGVHTLCHRPQAGVRPATLPPVAQDSPRVRNKGCI